MIHCQQVTLVTEPAASEAVPSTSHMAEGFEEEARAEAQALLLKQARPLFLKQAWPLFLKQTRPLFLKQA